MNLRLLWTTTLLVITSAPAWPQAHFDVASIRPSQPGLTARDARHSLRGDRFEAKAMTVGDLLDMVNGYQLFRVAGGPAWMRTDRYDIEAKAERALDTADGLSAVMALLTERFHLESRRESREVPGIVLRAPRTPGGVQPAGTEEGYSISNDHGDVIFTAVSMSSVTNYLSQMWRAPVADETELKGVYDFKLATSQVEPQPQMSFGDRVREAVESIGFRVENRRIPLEVTVVDRCERPTAN